MSNKTLGAYNIFDLREMVQRRLPKGIFEFVDRVMALLGCCGVADLNREYLVLPESLREVVEAIAPARPSLRAAEI